MTIPHLLFDVARFDVIVWPKAILTAAWGNAATPLVVIHISGSIDSDVIDPRPHRPSVGGALPDSYMATKHKVGRGERAATEATQPRPKAWPRCAYFGLVYGGRKWILQRSTDRGWQAAVAVRHSTTDARSVGQQVANLFPAETQTDLCISLRGDAPGYDVARPSAKPSEVSNFKTCASG